MISPRWTPRATATVAYLCIPCPCRRSFGTTRSDGNDDGSETNRRRRYSSPTLKGETPLYRARKVEANSDGSRVEADRRPRRPQAGSSKNDGRIEDGDAKGSSGDYWPQLQRRERAKRRADDGGDSGDGAANAALASVFAPRLNIQNPQGTKDSSLVMLVIDGLSSNLNAADFYRIAPKDLSNWQSVIKKDSFEPLGRYLLTFSTAQAAASYRDRLVRLHKLNGFKLRSASGLWESSVPAALKVSLTSPLAAASGPTTTTGTAKAAVAKTISDAVASSDLPLSNTESVVDLANSFTIAPASQETLSVQRRKVTLTRPWAKRLAGMVENLGFGELPHVLMLEVYPPTLSAGELNQFIRRDGESRGLRWPVSAPQHLKMNSNLEQAPTRTRGSRTKDIDQGEDQDKEDKAASNRQQQGSSFKFNDRETEEKLKGRFVLACTDEAEARRFQQSWNNRALTTLRPQPARYVVYASIISW
ncbi:hypothetical protein TGAM01_v209651 [Trichoderma gamsii]|uniref:Uncharacterized protein n=1 Tax=Trichoderma gamsii TaxID=398673 RepID=A0A2P4ZB13_9HYPO|nr:hypothetical protein TGAM01_v209651 [Trichoderma gamsii]PON21488.1 hypothetical protein TGAM01_v209651 [Trichoderma gamsii]